jgi:hypothetical protein
MNQNYRSTVIILGAGASFDAGFPLGSELIHEICQLYFDNTFVENLKRILWNNRDSITSSPQEVSLPQKIYSALQEGDSAIYWKTNYPEIQSWIHNLSRAASIDDFIFYRKECSILAKLGILAAISRHEIAAKWNPTQNEPLKHIWYHRLWKILYSGCISFDRFQSRLNRLNIITFNYDRSLDYFLATSAQALFIHDLEQRKIDPFSLFPIQHVYGAIGSLDKSLPDRFHGYKSVNFESKPKDFPQLDDAQAANRKFISGMFNEPQEAIRLHLYDKFLFGLAQDIQTYTEILNTTMLIKFGGILNEASHIYFLGFAFHEQNMRILFPSEPLLPRTPLVIAGTCYKLPETQLSHAKGWFKKIIGEKRHVLLKGLDSNDTDCKIDSFLDKIGIELAN